MLRPSPTAVLLVVLAVIASWIWRSGVTVSEPEPADVWLAPEPVKSLVESQAPAANALRRENAALGPEALGEVGIKVVVNDPDGVLELPFELKVLCGKTALVPTWARVDDQFQARLPVSGPEPSRAILTSNEHFLSSQPVAVGAFEREEASQPGQVAHWIARLDLAGAVCVIDLTLHGAAGEGPWRLKHPFGEEHLVELPADGGEQKVRLFTPNREHLEARLDGVWPGDVYQVRVPINSGRIRRELRPPSGALTAHLELPDGVKLSAEQKICLEPETRLGGMMHTRRCVVDSSGTVRFTNLPAGRYLVYASDYVNFTGDVAHTLVIDQREEIVHLRKGHEALRVRFGDSPSDGVQAVSAEWPRYPLVAGVYEPGESSEFVLAGLSRGAWRVCGYRGGAMAFGQAFVGAGELAELALLDWGPAKDIQLTMHSSFSEASTQRIQFCVTDAAGIQYTKDVMARPDMIFNYDAHMLVPPGPLRVEAFHASGLVGEGTGIVPDLPGPRVPVDVWLQFREP